MAKVEHLKKVTMKQARELMRTAQAYGVPMSLIKRTWKLYNLTDLRRGTFPKVIDWIKERDNG